MAVVYACFVVRSHFLAQSTKILAHANTMITRADVCEILAMKLIRHYAKDRILLATALTTSWIPTAGAPSEVIAEIQEAVGGNKEDLDDPICALEVRYLKFGRSHCLTGFIDLIQLAIATEAKEFLATSVVQTVVNDIYAGRIVYTTPSRTSSPALYDNYTPHPLKLYNVRSAPFLDRHRYVSNNEKYFMLNTRKDCKFPNTMPSWNSLTLHC